MINLKIEPNRKQAVIQVSEEFTDSYIIELVDSIKHAHEEYHLNTIKLEIASPGGEVLALNYFLEALEDFHNVGMTINTRAMTRVGSAAAIMLSMGDHRVAARCSRLLYHTARVINETMVTASMAETICQQINTVDESMIAHLVNRSRAGTWTPKPLNKKLLAEFKNSDWDVIRQLLGGMNDNGEDNQADLITQLRQHVDHCIADTDGNELRNLYSKFLTMDREVSSVLARELRLIDEITGIISKDNNRHINIVEQNAAGQQGCLISALGDQQHTRGIEQVHIPQWKSMFEPIGAINRDQFCRHTLILGETGSGKTASGILPVIGSILDNSSPIGCTFVIDPKKEIKTVLTDDAGQSNAEIHEIDLNKTTGSYVLNLMAGQALTVEDDLTRDMVLTAAQKILKRAASLTLNNPADTLNGKLCTARDPYWSTEGCRLAVTILAFTLIVLQHRVTIYGGIQKSSLLCKTLPLVHRTMINFGEQAGMIKPCPEIEDILNRERQANSVVKDQEYVIKPFLDSIHASSLYRTSKGFRDDVEILFKTMYSKEGVPPTTRLLKAIGFAAQRCLSDTDIQPSRNVISLASTLMESIFSHRIRSYDSKSNEKHYALLAMPLIKTLRTQLGGGEIAEVFNQIEFCWYSMANHGEHATQYTGVFGHSRSCFWEFSDQIPAQTLYFGCEPFYRSLRHHSQCHDIQDIDFSRSIDATDNDRRTIYIFCPDLTNKGNTLIAKSLKAMFFETVLNSTERENNGTSMPLVAYVADEFHRFITADMSHGEQSFLDTCRSFGAFCVLACQSVSSLRHSLTEMNGDSDLNTSAISVLLNNTCNKLFFRTTDNEARDYLDQLCPTLHTGNKVTTSLPPSTLAPGECYASLADGRFMRRQLEQYRVPDSAAPQNSDAVGPWQEETEHTTGNGTVDEPRSVING